MPVCILGMHRSGTSMIARLLNLCGLYLGRTEALMPLWPDDNEEGYWENLQFQGLNEEILVALGGSWSNPPEMLPGWSEQPSIRLMAYRAKGITAEFEGFSNWGWKDPRNSLTLEFWMSIFPDLKLLLCLRHPFEVAASLGTGRETRNFSLGNALQLWVDYHEHLLETVNPDQLIVTHYDTYFYNPQDELRRLVDQLEMQVDQQTIDAAIGSIKKRLKHQIALPPTLLENAGAAIQYYNAFCAMAGPVYQTMVADPSYQISALGSTAQNLSKKLASLEVKVTTVESALRDLNAQLAAERISVEQLDSQNSALTAQLGTEQAKARLLETSLENRLAELNARQTDLSHIQAQTRELERDFAVLNGRINVQRASRLLRMSNRVWRVSRRVRRAILSRLGRYAGPPALFDSEWYLSQVPDALEAAGGVYDHYAAIGWRVGFSPTPLFATQWYLAQNPDVQQAGIDPLLHYVKLGWREGRDPNSLFDTDWYLDTYPDVRQVGVEPLHHYLTIGWHEDRDPSPIFDTGWYLTAYPDVARSDINPLWHFLSQGHREEHSIKGTQTQTFQAQEAVTPLKVAESTHSVETLADVTPLFDEQWYTRMYQDVAQSGIKPLTHYLTVGWREGRRPNPIFDPKWYFQTYPEVALAGIEPLTYYLTVGWKKGHNPSEDFDADSYLQTYPDLAKAGVQPLIHYLAAGKREGRQIKRPEVAKSLTLREYQKNSRLTHISSGETVLVLGQDAYRAGSQILLLSLIEWLVYHTTLTVRLVLMRGGPLLADYQQLCDTLVLSGSAVGNEDSWGAIMRDFAGPNVATVYVNSVASVDMIQAAASLKKPILWHIHELKLNIERYCSDGLLLATLPQIAHIIACSDAVASCLRDDYGVSSELITTVTSFIYPTIPDEYRVRQLRQRLKLDDNTLVILGCGSVEWRKGSDLFVQVAAELRSRQIDGFQFIWIGLAEIAEMESRVEEIRKLGVENYVTFLGQQADPSIYFGLANIFALTSREDPFPLVALEAGFHGLPIVCFAESGGMPTVINEAGAEMGFVVPYEDIKAMADRIQLLLSDPGLRKWLGEQGRKKVLAQYTAEMKVPAILEVIREVASIRPKVSVIVPAYNHASFLKQRIESILNQTFRDFEIILLDDASSDDTAHILAEYSGHSGVTSVTNSENSGAPFPQWQKGLDLARADLIWIAEDDDFCEPTHLESLLPYFSDPDVKLAYCQTIVVGKHDEALYDCIHDTDEFSINRWQHSYVAEGEVEANYCLAVRNTIPNVSAVVFRRFDYSEWVKGWRTANLAGDWAFYLYAIHDGKLAYHPEKLNYHRQHEDTATHQTKFNEKRFLEIVQVQSIATNLYQLSDKCRVAMKDLAFQIWQQVFADRSYAEFELTYQSIIDR